MKPEILRHACRYDDPELPGQPVYDQAGVTRAILSRDSISSYLYEKLSKKGDTRICRVQVFTCQVIAMSKTFPEAERRSLHWMKADNAAKQVREPALPNILHRF